MMLTSRLDCPLSLKTPNMGNIGLHHFLGLYLRGYPEGRSIRSHTWLPMLADLNRLARPRELTENSRQ